MHLAVLTTEERATLLHTHYSFLLVIYGSRTMFFFPVTTSRQEHNWVGEASQSLQIQAAMVHGEVRKNLGKAEMCFAK